MSDYTKLPENVTGETLYQLMCHFSPALNKSWSQLEEWQRTQYNEAALVIVADRADRAKNTVRIPDKSKWPEYAQGIEVWFVSEGFKTSESGVDFITYVPRSKPTHDQLRAKLHELVESIPADELAEKVEKIEGVVG